MDIQDLKLKEVNLFLDLLKLKSVRELARQQRMQPGQVSKSMRALEQKLGLQLFERSATGVTGTASALELLPLLEGIQRFEQRLSEHLVPENKRDTLSFASTSFFSTHLLPELFAQLIEQHEHSRIRLLDLPPSQFIPVALRGGFQVCIHMQNQDWPQTWVSTQVGELKWKLYGRKGHPLLKNANKTEILKYPFVYPVYWTNDGIRYGQDNFPHPISRRIRGCETTTATSAVEIVRLTDHIGFLPELIVRSHVEQKQIFEISYKQQEEVSQPVYLAVKNDVIKQKMFQTIKSFCADFLLPLQK